MSYFLGVTGGIGSGKSVVSGIFGRLGWFVIDFDRLVSLALTRKDVVDRIVHEFGCGVLSPEGGLDRRKLSHLVFNDKDKRLRLQGILHPIVEEEAFSAAEKAERSGKHFILFDAPLLIETGFWKKVNWVLVVVAPVSERIKRASKRLGITEEEVLRRMESQMKDDERVRYADFVIVNDGTIDDLKLKVLDIHKKIKSEVMGYG